MKKIITILLSIIMALSLLPMTAYAEDISISYDQIENDMLDYSVFDSIIKLANAVDSKQYTDESYNALMASIVERDTLLTQQDIDDAAREIAVMYASLEKKSVTINLYSSNSHEKTTHKAYTASYGDTVELEVESDELVYKWVISTDEGTSKLDVTSNELTIMATSDIDVIAFSKPTPESAERTKAIRFLAFNGALCNVVYTEDVNNFDMPDAPELPFYEFVEWQKIDDTTYQASYICENMCDGVNHKLLATTVPPTCTAYGYVLFTCDCGVSYKAEYSDATGHSYNDEKVCTICGNIDTEFYEDEDSANTPSTDVTVPTTTPSIPENKNPETPGIDEGGYSNMVIMP